VERVQPIQQRLEIQRRPPATVAGLGAGVVLRDLDAQLLCDSLGLDRVGSGVRVSREHLLSALRHLGVVAPDLHDGFLDGLLHVPIHRIGLLIEIRDDGPRPSVAALRRQLAQLGLVLRELHLELSLKRCHIAPLLLDELAHLRVVLPELELVAARRARVRWQGPGEGPRPPRLQLHFQVLDPPSPLHLDLLADRSLHRAVALLHAAADGVELGHRRGAVDLPAELRGGLLASLREAELRLCKNAVRLLFRHVRRGAVVLDRRMDLRGRRVLHEADLVLKLLLRLDHHGVQLLLKDGKGHVAVGHGALVVEGDVGHIAHAQPDLPLANDACDRESLSFVVDEGRVPGPPAKVQCHRHQGIRRSQFKQVWVRIFVRAAKVEQERPSSQQGLHKDDGAHDRRRHLPSLLLFRLLPMPLDILYHGCSQGHGELLLYIVHGVCRPAALLKTKLAL